MKPLLLTRVSSRVLISSLVLNPQVQPSQQHNKSLPDYSVRTCPEKLETTFYLSCSNSASPPFDPSAVHVQTVRWIRYWGLQSVRATVSPTPNAAGQPVKMAQILYETPQLAAVATENLDGFALKEDWVMSVTYI